MKATLIKTDGTKTELLPDKGKHHTMELLQKSVGGYFEPIMLPKGESMYVNEEARLHGTAKFPENIEATNVLRMKLNRHDTVVLLGDVVLFEHS